MTEDSIALSEEGSAGSVCDGVAPIRTAAFIGLLLPHARSCLPVDSDRLKIAARSYYRHTAVALPENVRGAYAAIPLGYWLSTRIVCAWPLQQQLLFAPLLLTIFSFEESPLLFTCMSRTSEHRSSNVAIALFKDVECNDPQKYRLNTGSSPS